MKRLQPVVWTKGTFLSPQHLQIQDRFLENVLHFQLETLSFRPWGFRSLQIDAKALSEGLFHISAASGILPDGLLFDIPNSDGAPAPKELKDCFDPDQHTLDIHFAVPHYRDRGLNVANSQRQSGGARYTAEYETVPRRKHRAFRKAGAGGAQKFPLPDGGRIARWVFLAARGAVVRSQAEISSSTRTSSRRCSISAPAII